VSRKAHARCGAGENPEIISKGYLSLFVDWIFYNAHDGEYIIGHGGGAADQYGYCDVIAWKDAQPGDLVFYPDCEHVGIVVKNDAGTLTIIHCASGYNNVVMTQHDAPSFSGFLFAGRPKIYQNGM